MIIIIGKYGFLKTLLKYQSIEIIRLKKRLKQLESEANND